MGLTHCICRDGEASQGPRRPEDLPRTKALLLLFCFVESFVPVFISQQLNEYDVIHAEVVSKELPGQCTNVRCC